MTISPRSPPGMTQKLIARLVNTTFIRKVKGVENLPKGGAFILAANHCSYMDHMIINAVSFIHLNRVVSFLAKKEHFRGAFQKRWHKWVRAIPIDRQAGGKNALKKAIRHLKRGGIIGIYPEGTRSSTGKIQKGKTGVARLAVAAKVPVVPVGLKGTFEIMPKGKLFPKPKRADIFIGKPMYFEKYYGNDENRKIIRMITNNIMKSIAKLTKQRFKG